MATLVDIISNKSPLDKDTIKALIERYPWFEAARTLLEGGTPYHTIDYDKICEVSSGEIIDRFLRKGDYRIVAEEGEATEDICTELSLDEEDDLVSEELAEIYLAQGLKTEALEIYSKLCLLNPEKIAYFAEKIAEIKKSN